MTVTSVAPDPRIRINRRGRIVLGSLAGVPLALGIAFGSVNMASASDNSSTDVEFTYVTVGSEQTLWSIAERFAPEEDPRIAVQAIQTLNQLTSSTVHAGERLAIPAEYTS